MTATFDDLLSSAEFLDPDNDEQSDDTGFVPPDGDASFVEGRKQSARAKRYADKTRRGLNFVIKALAGHPKTVADSAALIQHGPAVAGAIGYLADNDERTRKFIDFITDDGIENPYILTALAVLPVAFQLMRNHEDVNVNVRSREFKLFRRRFSIPIRFRMRLPKTVRANTYAPDFMAQHIFGNPLIRAKFAEQDIPIAWPPAQWNGHG